MSINTNALKGEEIIVAKKNEEKSALELLSEMQSQITLLKDRAKSELAEKVQALRAELEEVNETCKSLGLDTYVITTATATVVHKGKKKTAPASGAPTEAQIGEAKKMIAASPDGIGVRVLTGALGVKKNAEQWAEALGSGFVAEGRSVKKA